MCYKYLNHFPNHKESDKNVLYMMTPCVINNIIIKSRAGSIEPGTQGELCGKKMF